MKNNCTLKVGDKIVEVGGVYRIFKIIKKKSLEDKPESHAFYKPLYKHKDNKTVICSIPQANVEKANIRKPVSKKKMSRALGLLGQMPNGENKILATEAKGLLKENDPIKSARALRLLWLDKKDESRNFSLGKKTIYRQAMRGLMEEIAVVYSIGLIKARKKIMYRLKKVIPKKPEEEGKGKKS